MGAHSLREETALLDASFWVGAADRAVKSFAQALLLLWGADQGLNLLHVDWSTALGLGGGGALLSLLTSIASARVGNKGTPSLLPGAS